MSERGYDPYDPPPRPEQPASSTTPFVPFGGITPKPVDRGDRRGLVILIVITLIVSAGGWVGLQYFLEWYNGRGVVSEEQQAAAVAREHPAKSQLMDRVGTFRLVQKRTDLPTDLVQGSMFVDLTMEKPFGALYQDPADPKRPIVISGSTQLIESTFLTMLGLALPGSEDGLVPVDPGPLGGLVFCQGNGKDTACVWVDHGSFGGGLFTDRKIVESAELLRRFRSALIVRPVSTPN